MAEFFKCCRSKANGNWVCIVCSNVFHPGCWKRTRHYEVLNNNLICCSDGCRELAARTNEGEYQVKSLLCLVQDLQVELTQKDNYIARLKRSSVVFEEDAMELESGYKREIEAYQLQISELELQVKQKVAIINGYEGKPYLASETQTIVMRQTTSTQTVNSTTTQCSQTEATHMRSSGTQTCICPSKEAVVQTDDVADAELCFVPRRDTPTSSDRQERPTLGGNHKTKAVQTRVTCLNNSKKSLQNSTQKSAASPGPKKVFSHQGIVEVGSLNDKHAVFQLNRTRLLVMGSGASVRNMPYFIKQKYNALPLDINCQYSTEPISLDEMANVGQGLCRHFTKTDHVLIFIDPRCAGNNKFFGLNTHGQVLEAFSHTNLIIVGAPQLSMPINQRQDVYEYNILIRKCVHASNNKITFIPMDSFLEQSDLFSERATHINRAKERLASYISCKHLVDIPELPNDSLSFEERLQRLRGGVDHWHPSIITFPKNYPIPSEALRGMTFPDVHMEHEQLSPLNAQNFSQDLQVDMNSNIGNFGRQDFLVSPDRQELAT